MRGLIALLFLAISMAASAGIPFEIPNNDIKFGDGTDVAKSIEFKMGLGTNPIFSSADGTSLKINIPFRADGDLSSGGNLTIGDGTNSDKFMNFLIDGESVGFKFDSASGEILQKSKAGGSYIPLGTGSGEGVGLIKEDSSGPAFTKTAANTLSVKAGTAINVNGTDVAFASDTAVVMPTLTPGTDYAIYICEDGTVRASDNFSAPSGYNTTNSKQVGGFHYGLVDDEATVASGSFPTTGGGMIWTQADVDKIKGINAYSIWDLKWRPKAEDPRGMTLVAGQFWTDIYFTNTNHEVNGTSMAGTDIASGTVLPKIPTMWSGDGSATYASGSWWNFSDIAKTHGKRLLNFQEFPAAAFGTTEASSLGGASETPPLTKREPGFTSKWGVEQATGHIWTWGADISGSTGSSSYTANTEGRGSTYAANLSAPRYGGARTAGSDSGSRASHWSGAPSSSYWYYGLRAASDHLVLE